jgi:prepilin-type N-terminal cleavage/methylation domain-containing protein/prepilin-type processing-associated H-X9-DG protein
MKVERIVRAMKRRSRGFTLIELLVVIAIIGLLASILFPVFARARENARRASCASNLKQLGLGIMQYVQDYDEYYPFSYGGGSSTTARYWSRDVFPYIKNSQVYVCPSADKPASIDVTNNTSSNFDVRYGMNNDFGTASYTCDNNPVGEICRPVKASAIPRPAELLLLIDTREGVSGWAPFMSTYTNPNTESRHFEGANIAYADGHVKWQKEVVYTKQAAEANYTRILPLWRKQNQAS